MNQLTRSDYFQELLLRFTEHIEANHKGEEERIEEEIMDFIDHYGKPLPEADPEPDYNGTTEAERIERMHGCQKLK